MTDFIKNINSNKRGGLIADGPWIEIDPIGLYSGTPLHGLVLPIDISMYLPDDGCDYWCQFDGRVQTNSSSGNNTIMQLFSGTGSNAQTQINGHVAQSMNKTAATRVNAGTVILPIFATDRTVTFVHGGSTSGTMGSTAIWLHRYRRLGTNK
jgi:hypothetical protein